MKTPTTSLGWGFSGTLAVFSPHEYLNRPTSEFSLPTLEHIIASKRNSTKGRYFDSKSREICLASHKFAYIPQENKGGVLR